MGRNEGSRELAALAAGARTLADLLACLHGKPASAQALALEDWGEKLVEQVACPICGKAPAVTFQVEALATVPLACATCHPLPRTSRETDAGPLLSSGQCQYLIDEISSYVFNDSYRPSSQEESGPTIDAEFKPIERKPRKKRGRKRGVVTLEKIASTKTLKSPDA